MKYGDYANKTDAFLMKRHDAIFDKLGHRLSSEHMELVHELCEVERELTLREEDPR